jgi:hypothetical protein
MGWKILERFCRVAAYRTVAALQIENGLRDLLHYKIRKTIEIDYLCHVYLLTLTAFTLRRTGIGCHTHSHCDNRGLKPLFSAAYLLCLP